MSLRETVDVARRGDERWCVEGGNGRPVALGVHSAHETKAAALREALAVAREYDADVRILDEPEDDAGDAGSWLPWR